MVAATAIRGDGGWAVLGLLWLIAGNACAVAALAGAGRLSPADALADAVLELSFVAWALLVARWVMLLPLLTTTAAFPLFNRVLAVNLQPLLPGELKSRRVAAALCARVVCEGRARARANHSHPGLYSSTPSCVAFRVK